MGQGGPCALWASCDSDPANSGASYWCGEHASGGGAGNDRQMAGGSLSIPLGVTYNTTKPELKHFADWTDARGAVVHAWMNGGGWFTMFEITSHDPKSGNISFENPLQPGFPKGGWQGGRNWQGVNGRDGAPWIVDGVFEELDQAGEWWFNGTTRQLFYWHNSSAPESRAPPPGLQLVAANLTTLIRIIGTMEVRLVLGEGHAILLRDRVLLP